MNDKDYNSIFAVTLEEFKKLKDQIESYSTKIENNTREIESHSTKIESFSTKIEDIEEMQESITELSLHGQWCGFQDAWTSPAVITYDDIFFEDSNMNNTVLNTGTGET